MNARLQDAEARSAQVSRTRRVEHAIGGIKRALRVKDMLRNWRPECSDSFEEAAQSESESSQARLAEMRGKPVSNNV